MAKRQRRVAEKQQRLAEKQEKLAQKQQRLAEEQREATEDILYVAHMRLAEKDWEEGHTMRLRNLLDRHLPERGGPDRRGWEWYYWLSLCHRDKMTLQSRSLAVPRGAWSPAGKYIAFASADEAVIVWDAKTGKQLIRVCGPGCSCVTWSPDGTHLAAGDEQGRIRVYKIRSADHTLTISTHTPDVRFVAWSPDGKRLASCSGDHTLTIWNAEDGRQEQTLTGHGNRVTALSWHPHGTRRALGGARDSPVPIGKLAACGGRVNHVDRAERTAGSTKPPVPGHGPLAAW